MHSFSTLFSAGVITFATLLGSSSATPQTNVINPIEGLSQCTQGIIFTILASSPCNPADFVCVCDTLVSYNARSIVASQCTAAELAQHDVFYASACVNNRRVSSSSTSAASVVTSTRVVNVTSIRPLTTGTGFSNATTTRGPFANGTVTVTGTIRVTSTIRITTTGANGLPSVLTSQVVVQGNPTSQPQFTGAAAAVALPDIFGSITGSIKVGLAAGAIGLMGLIFAEL